MTTAIFAQTLTFDAASVKPNKSGERRSRLPHTDPQRLTASNVTVRQLILWAYELPRYRLEGPAWTDTARFDVEATTDKPSYTAQFRLMLQTLLAERFQLKSHRETRDMRVFWLVAEKGGLKLHDPKEQAEFDKSSRSPVAPGMRFVMFTGELPALADYLLVPLGRPVLDRTGVSGRYFFHLQWADNAAGAEPGPSLPTALREQFGLRLEPHREDIEVMIIDRVERPSEN